MKERFALCDHVRVIRHRPGVQDFALGAMSDPECRSIAQQRARDRGHQHPLEHEVAAGYQRAQRQDNRRARDHRAYDGNCLQEGGEE
jgi:hypothetical protein